MMFLSKEILHKDEHSKTQMMVAIADGKEKNIEFIWEEAGFSNDAGTDLTITKANFLENTLVYVNQETISPVKDGEAIYLEFVILGQIMPMANPNPAIDLDNYEFKEHECLLYTPLDYTVDLLRS